MSNVEYPNFGMSQGWQCPNCKTIWSPHTVMCYTCSGNTLVMTGTGTAVPANDNLMPTTTCKCGKKTVDNKDDTC